MKNVPIHLSSFKSKVDRLDVEKLVTVPVKLSKLSNVVKMGFYSIYRPPTSNTPAHRPADSIIIFKRLGIRKMIILQNTAHDFERQQKKTWLSINYVRKN